MDSGKIENNVKTRIKFIKKNTDKKVEAEKGCHVSE